MVRMINPLRKTGLTGKLTMMVVGASVATATVVGVVTALIAVTDMRESRIGQLQAAAESSADDAARYFEAVHAQFATLARSDMGRKAVSDLRGSWDQIASPNRMELVQQIYIRDNPNPVGQKELMTRARTAVAPRYARAHERHHDALGAIKTAGGYYDIFLIDPDGNVIYTVEKEADFGASLLTGPLADSGLSRVFRTVRDNPDPAILVFSDYAAYAPSAGAPASFMAVPVLDDAGVFQGALAVQIPDEAISEILLRNARSGFSGLSVSIYMIGEDGILRSDLGATPEGDSLTRRALSVSRLAAGLQEAVTAETTGATGEPVNAGIAPAHLGGARLYMVAEAPSAELDVLVRALQWQIVTAALIVIAVVSALGSLLARWFAGPIRHMTGAVERLIAGEDVEVPARDRSDEIGVLARSMTAIYDASLEARRIRSALDSATAALMITDADFNIIYANHALQAAVGRSRGHWQQIDPSLDTRSLIGINIDRFHKNPAHQRNVLRALRKPLKGAIAFDGRDFSLTMAPVTDTHGAHIGYVAEWVERTEALKTEQQIAGVIDAVAAGDFSQRLSLNSDDKFIVNVAEGMNRVCGIVDGFLADIERSLTAIATGDLTQRVEAPYSGRLGEVSSAVNDTVAALGRLVSDITTAVASINGAVGEISDGARQLSSRTESQASSLEQTAATMEQMAATVKSNAENAIRANALAADTSKRAEHGQDVVLKNVAAMSRIKDSAGKIAEIISVIDGIAFQTNLLALNAAVEAARAGDAGKGFAVVASEVRTLAQRSSQAAKDITALIGESTSHVAEGAELTESAGSALREIVEGIATVAETVDGITAASREQSTGIDEISQAVSHLDSMTQENASLSDHSAATARTLTSEAGRLANMVAVFRLAESPGETAGTRTATPERRSSARFASTQSTRTNPSGPASHLKPDAASHHPESLRKAAGSDWSEF